MTTELDIRYCKEHTRNYDVRWGCSACPDPKDKKIKELQEKVKSLQEDVLNWKDSWFQMRNVAGKLGWKVPPISYLLPANQQEMIKQVEEFTNKPQLQLRDKLIEVANRYLNRFDWHGTEADIIREMITEIEDIK